MADRADPIDSTPAKRRKISNSGDSIRSRVWDSENDSGDELDEDDFEAATIATLPLGSPKRKQPQSTATSLQREVESPAPPSTAGRTWVTQSTQPLGATQPTQPIVLDGAPPSLPHVQVGRSSPASSPPRTKPPEPIRRAPFAKPSLLASAMAPPGTSFQRPLAPPSQPAPLPRPAGLDFDSDEDPPVQHSDDEETQTFRSNLKPTNFHKGGRGVESSPPNRVEESPSSSKSGAPTKFMELMSGFAFNRPSPKAPDDMVSAYSSASRSRPQLPASSPSPAAFRVQSATLYHTLDDIDDSRLRKKVQDMQMIMPKTVQQCVDALSQKRGNIDDAMAWLVEMEDQEEMHDQMNLTPAAKKGQAHGVGSNEISQPIRLTAKQQVQAPARSIAEKYGSTQAARRKEAEADDVKPRRRLLNGRKPTSRAASPLTSPVLPTRERKPPVVVIDSDSEPEAAKSGDESEGLAEPAQSDHRLMKFFNECSVRDLAELSAQSEETVQFVLDHRPFRSLDEIRAITRESQPSRSGRRARATRPIGDKLVEDCSEMLTGYDAVDELVAQCETIAQPVQKALKSWGVGEIGGELQLMNLDENHDSGVGTPSSSASREEASTRTRKKSKGAFIGQPENMSPEVTLKDYQLVGLNWLNLLFTKELSCILADDMGLGKTCQIIAFMSYLQLQKVDGVHLIIVPGSTLENWLREFERFAPNLNVRPYYGSQAQRVEIRYSLEQAFDDLDVIVTTYDMAVAAEDNKFLRRLGPYSVCVYDEAHALRNPESLRYNQLVRIGADFKVLLTGTPLQNNLQELIAILAFIMPELFEKKREALEYIFRHKASTKSTEHAALLSSERVARARTMMAPFILRRKKHQVLELPAKHNRVEYCDMTEAQTAHYYDVLGQAQQFFTDRAAGNVKGKGNAKASSNVLMALRSAAIHPLLSRRLYTKTLDQIVAALAKSDEFGDNSRDKIRAYISGEAPISLKGGDFGLHRFCAERPLLRRFALQHSEWMDSGKVARFVDLITQYARNGDRTLVFSQFTTVLDILEAVLETLAIKFMRLDGSTKMDDRQDMIDQFTFDTSIPVFMLSTRAGGAGINLAAANKVIIFDSGFNPQDDIQAENRAHRVGQTREVEVVRLVTRGTIEEQIHALGESKLALDERVAGGDDVAPGGVAAAAAASTEDKQAEKEGEKLVERMLVDKLTTFAGEGPASDPPLRRATPGSQSPAGEDIRDEFKQGLEAHGLRIASKQARF